jgi:hypothetical protein
LDFISLPAQSGVAPGIIELSFPSKNIRKQKQHRDTVTA